MANNGSGKKKNPKDGEMYGPFRPGTPEGEMYGPFRPGSQEDVIYSPADFPKPKEEDKEDEPTFYDLVKSAPIVWPEPVKRERQYKPPEKKDEPTFYDLVKSMPPLDLGYSISDESLAERYPEEWGSMLEQEAQEEKTSQLYESMVAKLGMTPSAYLAQERTKVEEEQDPTVKALKLHGVEESLRTTMIPFVDEKGEEVLVPAGEVKMGEGEEAYTGWDALIEFERQQAGEKPSAKMRETLMEAYRSGEKAKLEFNQAITQLERNVTAAVDTGDYSKAYSSIDEFRSSAIMENQPSWWLDEYKLGVQINELGQSHKWDEAQNLIDDLLSAEEAAGVDTATLIAMQDKFSEMRREYDIPEGWFERIQWGVETGGGIGKVGRPIMALTAPTLENFNEAWWGEKAWAAGLYGLATQLPGHQEGEEEFEQLRKAYPWYDPWSYTTLPDQFEIAKSIYEDAGEDWAWALEMTHPVWIASFKVGGPVLRGAAGVGMKVTKIPALELLPAAAGRSLTVGDLIGTRGIQALELTGKGLHVAGAPARATLAAGTIGQNVVGRIVTVPAKAMSASARGIYRGLEYVSTSGGFKEVSAMAKAQGFELVRLPAPAAKALKHPYRVEGRGVNVLARDLQEVQRLVTTGELFEAERFYVPALKRVVGAQELETLNVRRIARGIPAEGIELGGYDALGESIFRSVVPPKGLTSDMAVDGARAFNALRRMEVTIPRKLFTEGKSVEEMISLGFKEDGLRRTARVFDVPGIREVINALNRSALAQTEIAQTMIVWGRMREFGSYTVSIANSHIRRLGNPVKEFGIGEVRDGDTVYKALCDPRKVRTLEGFEDFGLSIGGKVYHPIGDVIEHPHRYALSDQQTAMVQGYWRYVDELKTIAEKNGVDLRDLGFAEGDHYFPRFCLGKDGVTIQAKTPIKEYFGAKQTFDLSRVFDEQALGIKLGYEYEGNPLTILDGVGRAIHNRVADQQAATLLKKHGLSKEQIVELMKPGHKAYTDDLVQRVHTLEHARQTLIRAADGHVPGVSMAKLRREFPDIASQLSVAMEFKPQQAQDAIKALRKEMTAASDANLAQLDDAIRVAQSMREPTRAELRTATYEDIKKALKLLGQTAKPAGKEIEADDIARIIAESGLSEEFIRESGLLAGKLAQSELHKALNVLTKAVRKGSELTAKDLDDMAIESGLDAKVIKSAVQSWNVTEAQLKKAQTLISRQLKKELGGKHVLTKAELKQYGLDNGLDYNVFMSALRVVRENPAMKTVTKRDIDTALKVVKADERQSIKMLTKLYEQDAVISKREFRQRIAQLREPVERDLGELSVARRDAEAELAALRERAVSLPPWEAQKVFGKAGLPEETAARVHEVYAFSQTTYPKSTTDDIVRVLGDRGNRYVDTASKIQAVPRFAMTGMDWGYFMIQGLPLLATNPEAFAKATAQSMKAFASPDAFDAYLARPATREVVDRLLPHGLLAGAPASDFTESIFGGYLGKVLPRAGVEVGGRRVSMATGPMAFARGFEAFGTAARIEGSRSLLPRAKNAAEEKIIADYMNKMTGVISSRALGIGKTQREAEGAMMLFSPRYTRASFALMMDVTRGGLRGQLAREAMGSMMAAGAIYYTGICLALGQEPNFDPRSGKFMTVEIAGYHMGIGSIWTSMSRLLGNSLGTMMENPRDFFKWNPADPAMRRDNPLARFVSGRLTPITGTMYDVLLGETYIGEPLDSPAAYGEYVLARNLLPFYLMSQVEARELNVMAMGAEFMGARTWALQPWEIRNDLLEKYAMDDLGKHRSQLTFDEKRRLEREHADLATVTQQSHDQRSRRGDVSDKRQYECLDRIDELRAERDDNLAQAQRELEINLILADRLEAGDTTLTADQMERADNAGRIFREKISKAREGYYISLDGLKNVYNDVFEEWDSWDSKGKIGEESLTQRAQGDWFDYMMDGAALEDEFGNPLWDEIDRREDAFIAKWGSDWYGYIKERNIPAELNHVIDLSRAKRKMKDIGWWDVEEKLKGVYPQNADERDVIAQEKAIFYMRSETPEHARIYELVQDLETSDPDRARKARNTREWSSVVTAYNRAIAKAKDDLDTLREAVEREHERMRRENPKLDEWLQIYYGRKPLTTRPGELMPVG